MKMKMFVWKKKLFLIEKFFSELMWIWDVDISYDGVCVVVVGDGDDCNSCLCVLESLLLMKKGGEYELW